MKIKNILIIALSILFFVIKGIAQKTPSVPYPKSVEEVKIFNIMLLVKTANISDAGSDDDVYIKLNTIMVPFYLNNSKDDRERGKQDIYYIVDPTVKTIGDIKDLTLTKQGTNGWAITSVQLMINDRIIFERTLNNKWIDSNDGKLPEIIFTSKEMRKDEKWRLNKQGGLFFTFPHILNKSIIEKMIETLVGNSIRYDRIGPPCKWATGPRKHGEAVEAKQRNSQTLSFDLDLEYSVNTTIIETDIDFDLVITCNAGKIDITVQNQGSGKIVDGLKVISEYLNKSLNIPVCNASFDKNGNLIYW